MRGFEHQNPLLTRIINENGKSIPLEVEETGLGRYRSRIPLATNAGDLTISLRDKDSDKQKILSFTAQYPKEYRLSKDLPEPIAALTSFNSALIRDSLTKSGSHRPMVHWFVFAGMLCLLAGMVLRRI